MTPDKLPAVVHGDAIQKLSQRERVVLELTAHGFTSNEIAHKLVISSKTVETYRARIMRKFNFTHRSELVRLALQSGLLHA